MNVAELSKYGDIFGSLNEAIGKEKWDSKYKVSANNAARFLGEIVRGLEDIASSNRGAPTLWNDSREIETAKEVLRLYGFNTSKLSPERIENIAGYFRKQAEAFAELIGMYPMQVYKSVPKRQGLLNVCEKLKILGDGEDELFWDI